MQILFAIIEQNPRAKEWIYSNYIQIQCRSDANNINRTYFEFFPYTYAFFECPLLHTQYIDRKFVKENWKSIEDFLIYCIDHDYYVYVVCNEKWILQKEKDYFHELFIYA